MLHNHHHLSFGAGIIGQTVAAVPSGLSLTPRGGKKIDADVSQWNLGSVFG
jgi:hypothetical protein